MTNAPQHLTAYGRKILFEDAKSFRKLNDPKPHQYLNTQVFYHVTVMLSNLRIPDDYVITEESVILENSTRIYLFSTVPHHFFLVGKRK